MNGKEKARLACGNFTSARDDDDDDEDAASGRATFIYRSSCRIIALSERRFKRIRETRLLSSFLISFTIITLYVWPRKFL